MFKLLFKALWLLLQALFYLTLILTNVLFIALLWLLKNVVLLVPLTCYNHWFRVVWIDDKPMRWVDYQRMQKRALR